MEGLNKSKKIICYVCAFLIPIVIMAVIMYIRNCYPFGDAYTILRGDAYHQYIQFFYILHERIEQGGSLLFSWDHGMGYDFFTVFFYYLSNPINFIILLFGKQNIELGMIVAIMIQMGGCAVSAMYYLTHSKINRMKDEKWNLAVCLLFSLAYALCDYILAYRYNIMWLMGMILIPLLMLGVEYLVDKNDGRLYGILLFIGFISNFYFAWFLCIWSVVCFIEQKKENAYHWKKSFLKFALTSILAALCAAVVLVPSYLSVLGRDVSTWYSLSDFKITDHDMTGNFFNGFFWGHNMSLFGTDLYTQNNYCGVFVLVLTCLYFFNKNIERWQRIKRMAEIVFFYIGMNWVGALWVLHGFTISHGYLNRYAVLLVFLLLMTAFESLYKVYDIRIRYIGIVTMILFGIFLLVIFQGNLMDPAICYLVTMFLCVYLVICLFLHRRGSIKRNTLLINLCILGFIELVTNPLFSNENYAEPRTEIMANTAEWKKVYQDLDIESGERKTAYMISGYNIFHFSQTDMVSSSIHPGVMHLFGKLGLSEGKAGGDYAYVGTTPLTASLLNVRYVLTKWPEKYGGYHLQEQTDEYSLYNADSLIGLGFMLPEAVCEWNTNEQNMFEVQNNFSVDVLGKRELFTPVSFEDMDVQSDAQEVVAYMDGTYSYVNQNENAQPGVSLLFTATIPEDMELYISTENSNNHLCIVFIDGEVISPELDSDSRDRHAIYVGKVYGGQKLQVYIADESGVLGYAILYPVFYQYHEDVMQECLSEMQQSVYNIEIFEDTYISGTIDAIEDGILYLSIPYYKGFSAYVDGESAEIIQIGDAMIGLEISAGSHKVEFQYFTYGLKTGIALSLIGIILVIGIAIYKRKQHNSTMQDN